MKTTGTSAVLSAFVAGVALAVGCSDGELSSVAADSLGESFAALSPHGRRLSPLVIDSLQ